MYSRIVITYSYTHRIYSCMLTLYSGTVAIQIIIQPGYKVIPATIYNHRAMI